MKEAADKLSDTKLGWGVLFLSSATLICCALPISLVFLGLGATSAALFASAPWLAEIALHKNYVFAFAVFTQGLAYWSIVRSGRQCPTDPILAQKCVSAMRWNKRALGVSVTITLIGAFAAYGAAPLYRALQQGT